MSYYSTPVVEEQVMRPDNDSQQEEEDNEYQELQSDSIPLDPDAEDMSPSSNMGDVMCVVRRTSRHHVLDTETLYHEPDGIMRHGPETTGVVLDDGDNVWIWGMKIKKRHLGMSAAAFCGVWGGSILAVRTPQWVEGNNNNERAVEFLWLLLTVCCYYCLCCSCCCCCRIMVVVEYRRLFMFVGILKAHEMVQIQYQRYSLLVELFHWCGHCHDGSLADPVFGQRGTPTWGLYRRLSRSPVLSPARHVESGPSLGALVVDWELL
jgi:hypothetical protein